MLGWELPQLHAALNDLPAALLLVAVLFEVLAHVNRRESLRAAAFWMLLAGTVGAGLAVVSGLLAEDAVLQTAGSHDLFERHETLAYLVLGVFAVLSAWRLLRRAMARAETAAYLTVALVGVVLLVATSKIGGRLVFDHALGIRTETLQAVQAERAAPLPDDEEGEQQEGTRTAPEDRR